MQGRVGAGGATDGRWHVGRNGMSRQLGNGAVETVIKQGGNKVDCARKATGMPTEGG